MVVGRIVFLELTLGKTSEFQGLHVAIKAQYLMSPQFPSSKLQGTADVKQVAACGSDGENYISACCLGCKG